MPAKLQICCLGRDDLQKYGNPKSRCFNFPAKISRVHFYILCVGVHVHNCFHELSFIFRWCCMLKHHVGSFFHVLTSNPADFDLLITDFAVQVIIFFKYIGAHHTNYNLQKSSSLSLQVPSLLVS